MPDASALALAPAFLAMGLLAAVACTIAAGFGLAWYFRHESAAHAERMEEMEAATLRHDAAWVRAELARLYLEAPR
jgi:hypothetical protein